MLKGDSRKASDAFTNTCSEKQEETESDAEREWYAKQFGKHHQDEVDSPGRFSGLQKQLLLAVSGCS